MGTGGRAERDPRTGTGTATSASLRSEFQGVEVKRGRRYKNPPLDPPHRPLEMASESNSSGLNDHRISLLQILADFEYPKVSITLAVPVRQASNFVLAAARGRSSSLQRAQNLSLVGPAPRG